MALALVMGIRKWLMGRGAPGQTLVRHYGDELFFSFNKFSKVGRKGENEPLLLSNQELDLYNFFFQ